MRRWAPIAAAATVVVVAAGGVALTRAGSADDAAPVDPVAAVSAAPTTTTSPTPPNPLVPETPPRTVPARPMDLDEALAKDGDTVTGSGYVIIAPDGSTRFCPPGGRSGEPAPDAARPDVFLLPPPACSRGLVLVGVDASRLAAPRSYGALRWGSAAVTGRLSGDTLTVTAQGAPRWERMTPAPLPDRPPCPSPAGGWPRSHPSPGALATLQAYLIRHPAEFGQVSITYPYGATSKGPDFDDAQVALVTTVLDVPTATARLRTVFGGSLCLRRIAHSAADVDLVWRRIGGATADARWKSNGAYLGQPDTYAGRVRVNLLLVDAGVAGWIRAADPDRVIDVYPVLRPVR